MFVQTKDFGRTTSASAAAATTTINSATSTQVYSRDIITSFCRSSGAGPDLGLFELCRKAILATKAKATAFVKYIWSRATEEGTGTFFCSSI